jgi:hypothetical protein
MFRERMRTKIFGLALSILLPLVASAQCPKIQGQAVIFGGRGSTTVEMQGCYPDFLALSNVEGDKFIACLAKQIDAIEPLSLEQKFVIAGHSSGAAQAERLVQTIKDKSKVRLVLLEGFASPKNQRGVETTCWYARNGKLEGMNASYMQNPANCTGEIKSFDAPTCNTALCLHLALVNLNVQPDLNRRNVFPDGLKNCQGNMDWLNK